MPEHHCDDVLTLNQRTGLSVLCDRAPGHDDDHQCDGGMFSWPQDLPAPPAGGGEQ